MKVLKFFLATLLALVTLAALVLYEGDIPHDVVDARYSSPTSQFLDLGDEGRIHFRDEGDHRSTPIVLLHGSNASLHAFEPWVAELEQEFRLISIDLPGHGLTGEIPLQDYSTERYVDTVNKVAEHLELNSFVIAGNSMGGGVAWRFTSQYPDKVIGLVLIDSSGVPRPPTGDDAARRESPAAFRLLRMNWFRQIARHLDPYYLVYQGLKSSFVDQSVINEAMILRYYDMNLREGTRQATLMRFEQSAKRQTLQQGDITVPTLIMWGKEDSLIPFAYGQTFEKLIPQARTAYYDQAGHLPMEEIPAQSAADLAEFVRDLIAEAGNQDSDISATES